VFSNKYIVKGVLFIPYAEIREPFYAWYDSDVGNSRIDYYGGNLYNLFFNYGDKRFEIY